MPRWLQPDRLVPIDGKVKQWATEVVETAGSKTELEKVKAIYDHVVSTVKYDKTGEGWGKGDIEVDGKPFTSIDKSFSYRDLTAHAATHEAK